MFTHWTPDDKYSHLNIEKLLQHLQMQLSQKQKNLAPIFIFQFGYLYSILKSFKKQMTLIADGFLNRWIPQNMIK